MYLGVDMSQGLHPMDVAPDDTGWVAVPPHMLWGQERGNSSGTPTLLRLPRAQTILTVYHVESDAILAEVQGIGRVDTTMGS